MDTPRVRSPFGLIQEELRDDPWRLLIACVMLNLTSIKQVRPVIWQFFERFPTPSSITVDDKQLICEMIKSLGLYNRRAESIIRLSAAFQGNWSDVRKLPGVGKYAADSFRIFVEGKLDVKPTDKKLQKYLEWALTHENS